MQAQRFVVFIYGINIPGARIYTKATIVSKLGDIDSSFKVLAIGPRPDSIIIEARTPSVSEVVRQWVERHLPHPVVVRTFEEAQQVYLEACFMAERRYGHNFDRLSARVCLNGVAWELGAVFVGSKIDQSAEVSSSTNVIVVGSLGNDTAIVLKRPKTLSGSRIMWGNMTNAPVKKAWERALGRPVLCTSRSMTIVGKLIELGNVPYKSSLYRS